MNNEKQLRVKFWGVRGSIPVPGPKTIKFGGNTSCVEVDCGGEIIIIDGGTGIRPLGEELLERCRVNGDCDKRISIFFSHVHWDHIHGFPFFSPAFRSGQQITLYGSKHSDVDIENSLRGQMIAPHFPLVLRDMPSRISFHPVEKGMTIQLGEAEIHSVELNHPNGAYGYRIDYQNHSVTYVCDHEFSEESEERIIEFSRGTDLLIHDSQYTPEEYTGKDGGTGRVGWGHSTWKMAVDLAAKADVGEVALFHHGRDDEGVTEIEREAQKVFSNAFAAYEGAERLY